ncbi:MAG: RdgB/HAM1 family non-canonical purine NTP pyrophosphatase, partial [Rhodothermales bacterium]
MRMTIVLATRNPGKVKELSDLLSDLSVELVLPAEDAPQIDEDQPTLEGNAHKKAVVLSRFAGLPALADDTGLEVDALGGEPGVQSARFAGVGASDAENRRLLLRRLEGIENRAARFRTVLAFSAAGDVHLFEGICEGRIIDHEKGARGFGYDAIFVPDGRSETFAEMTREEKNAISHRAKALLAFRRYLK